MTTEEKRNLTEDEKDRIYRDVAKSLSVYPLEVHGVYPGTVENVKDGLGVFVRIE